MVRIPLTKPEYVRVGRARMPRPLPSPQLILVGGFAALTALGTLLLLLPFATAPGRTTSFLDALFTATSAVSVTGLVVVDTGTHWTFFGQAVVLVLIQLGGLGFMTASTLIFTLLGRRATLRERLLLREALGAGALGEVTRLAWNIVVMTFAVELTGLLIFFIRFTRDAPLPTAIWWSAFHSISAFNNAGFDVLGEFRSLTPYNQDAYLLVSTSVLVILGGLGYAFIADLHRARSFDSLTLNGKLVLLGTVALIVVGTGLFFLTERRTQTLASLSLPEQVLNSFFLSVSARTAGFSSVDLVALQEQSLFLMAALMFIGGAAGSTAGGIKVNTFALLVLVVLSAIRGKARTEAYGREVPQEQVFRALTVVVLAASLVFLAALVLTSTETADFLHLLFETVSAFGTVGLSVGLTPTLSGYGRAVLVVLMFVGRLGPLTLVLALVLRQRQAGFRYPSEQVVIG